MSMFGKRGGLFGGLTSGGITGGGLSGGLFDNGPSVGEKIEMLFTDVETEGKKRI